MVPALEKIIQESDSIVFFGGAGVSTESGIPDFRSVDGLYHQKYDYPPETILSHTFWEQNPEEFYRFYRDKLIVKGARPNAAHLRLAKLEREGKLKAVVTQNIDGLHQAAGSRTVYELHGSTLRNYCTGCGKFYDIDPNAIRGQGRTKATSWARHIAIYLTRHMTKLSLKDIGKEFDNRDHTTILHSIDRVEKQCKTDPETNEVIKDIRSNINERYN